MAKSLGDRAEDAPQDTSRHAKPYSCPDGRYLPGKGVLLSKSMQQTYSRNCGGDSMLLPEKTILLWAKAIEANRLLQMNAAAADADESDDVGEDEGVGRKKDKTYPGTDTIDPEATDPDSIWKRDDFRIDASHSTLGIFVTSCTPDRYLNGSAVGHGKYIHIRVTTPDGRNYLDVAMSFDQFTTALVSTMHTPCTCDYYWSAAPGSVALQEVVRSPDSIKGRMQQRLERRLQEGEKDLQKVVDLLNTTAEAGKSMSKTKLAEVAKELTRMIGRMASSASFTVEQAGEEVAAITERAAIDLAIVHSLRKEEILEHPGIRNLLREHPKLITQEPASERGTETEPIPDGQV